MQKYARFAATFLSAGLTLVVAGGAFAADLRPIKDPAKIAAVFPATAKVRLLNVWATWCIPCVIEMPDLRAIDEAFGAEVAVTGVSLDDMIPGAKAETVENFLDKYRIAFPNVYYTGNPDDLGERLDFNGEIPITIIYDARGKELWRQQGRIDRDKTIAQLREQLNKK
jgi:thiol-disulfide isomerase/thioredoxin